MGLSCCKSHWKGFEDQIQNPVELIPCALWWDQLPPPAFPLSWPADLFVLAQILQSILSAAPKSELAECGHEFYLWKFFLSLSHR